MTLGCKVNQYDADAMRAVLDYGGFEVREWPEAADVYVVNTCAVTSEAERKSRQAVTRILKINPEAEIYVCGCASQNNFSQFARDGVKFISGTKGKLVLAEELVKRQRAVKTDFSTKSSPQTSIPRQSTKSSAVRSLCAPAIS